MRQTVSTAKTAPGTKARNSVTVSRSCPVSFKLRRIRTTSALIGLLLCSAAMSGAFVSLMGPGPARAEEAPACTEIRAVDGKTVFRSAVLPDMTVDLSFECAKTSCRASVTHADQSLKVFEIESERRIEVCTREYVPSGRPTFADCGLEMRAFEFQMKTRVAAGFDRYFEADFVWLAGGVRQAARCIKLIDSRFEFDGSENALQPQKSWIVEPFRIAIYEFDNTNKL